jgi:hypothetical protein
LSRASDGDSLFCQKPNRDEWKAVVARPNKHSYYILSMPAGSQNLPKRSRVQHAYLHEDHQVKVDKTYHHQPRLNIAHALTYYDGSNRSQDALQKRQPLGRSPRYPSNSSDILGVCVLAMRKKYSYRLPLAIISFDLCIPKTMLMQSAQRPSWARVRYCSSKTDHHTRANIYRLIISIS